MKKEKKLGMLDLVLLGLGYTIGSGIFVLMGTAIGMTGRSVWLAVAAATFICFMAFWQEPVVTSMFVVPGGEYAVKSMLLPPFLSGMTGLIMLFSTVTMASYGMGIVSYAISLVPGLEPYTKLATAAVLTLFFILTFTSSKMISKISGIMTAVLVIALTLFVVIGLPKTQYAGGTGDPFFLNGGTGFFFGMAMMVRACQGTTSMPCIVMTETKDARRKAPIAMIWTTVLIALIYGIMAFVASSVLPISEVAGKNLAVVAKELFPHWFYVIFILFGAIFAIATSLVTLIMAIRVPCQHLAVEGWFPKVFSKTLKNGTPWAVTILLYLISVLPILLGFSLEALTSYSLIPLMLLNIYLNLACIPFRKKYSAQWEKSILHVLPVPVFNVLCVLGAAAAGLICFNLFRVLTRPQLIGMIVVLIILAAWGYFRLKTGAVSAEALRQKKEAIAQKALEASAED